MSDDADLEQRLAAMRRGYASKLRTRLVHLRSAVEQARGGDREALDEAVREAHRLHGTAGSYGFAETSLAIGEVEVALKRIAAEGAESPGEWDAVSERIGLALADPSLGADLGRE